VRPWYASLWFRVALGAVILVLAAIVAAPFFIPVDAYRPLLVAALANATGRQVHIDALKLSVAPRMRITLENVRVRNPTGFPAGDAFVAKTIDLGIDPRALRSRHLVVTYIAPSGVDLNILRNAKGTTNLAIAPQGGGSPAAGALTLEPLGPVRVSNAKISFSSVPVGTQPSYAITGVNGTIGGISPQSKDWFKKLTVNADLKGAQLTSSLLAKPLNFQSGKFAFSSGRARGTFASTIASLQLAGDVTFTRLDPLQITFALSSPKVDLNVLSGLLRQGAPQTAAAQKLLLAQGTVKVGEVSFGSLAATNLSGQLNVYTTAFELKNCTFTAYSGTVHGDAAIDEVHGGNPTTAAVQVRGMNVARVVTAVAHRGGGVNGTLEGTMHLHTLLSRDPVGTLTGSGTFAIRNGTLPSPQLRSFQYLGGDLRIARERGYSNHITLLAPGLKADGSGSFGFNQTIGYSGTALVNTSANLGGSQSAETVALQQAVAQALQRNIGTSSFSVPFTLRGTLSNPQFAMSGTPTPANVSTQQPNKSVQTIQSLQQLFLGGSK
jgi:uncharacterized protein involved in outer membrane biogenesis